MNEDVLVITGPSNIDNGLIFIGVIAAVVIIWVTFNYWAQSIKDSRQEKNSAKSRQKKKKSTRSGMRVWEVMDEEDDDDKEN